MDLNLHLGFSLSSHSLTLDLGSDLSLSSLPFSSSSIQEILMPLPRGALHPVDQILSPEYFLESFNLPAYTPIPRIISDPQRTSALNSPPYSRPLILDVEALARGRESQSPHFPSPPLVSTIPQGGHTLQRELLEYQEFRLQRLFESTHRWEITRFQSSHDESSFNAHPSTDPERLMRDIRSSGSSLGAIGKHKVHNEGVDVEDSKEKSNNASDFECNICFEMAKEPVVTSCGHLFCWPCLYQWLHLHCEYKECPLCKGKVIESNIVPIYGRGSSETSVQRRSEEDGDSGLKIPPRPRGNRVESLRHHLERPILRRTETLIEEHLHELLDEAHQRLQRVRREERHSQSLPRNSLANPQIRTTSSLLQDGTESLQQSSFHGPTARLSAIAAEFHSLTRRSDQAGVITSADSRRDPEPILSQASTSSTMAVIQGDIAATDALVEPNHGGSLTATRRRGRSRISDSLDVDGGLLPVHQRRRLN